RARADRADDLVRLGRREDELHVLGRLLDDLEQRVEALRGHHVGLVEDEHLEAVARGGEGRALTQVARVVDAAVRGGVDLDDVERTGPAARELDARGALPARGVGGPLGAVEAARKDARRRRLPAPARAGEQVGVVDPAAAQGLLQGAGHVLLADHLVERVGPVAAVQRSGHRRTLGGATDARYRVWRLAAPRHDGLPATLMGAPPGARRCA